MSFLSRFFRRTGDERTTDIPHTKNDDTENSETVRTSVQHMVPMPDDCDSTVVNHISLEEFEQIEKDMKRLDILTGSRNPPSCRSLAMTTHKRIFDTLAKQQKKTANNLISRYPGHQISYYCNGIGCIEGVFNIHNYKNKDFGPYVGQLRVTFSSGRTIVLDDVSSIQVKWINTSGRMEYSKDQAIPLLVEQCELENFIFYIMQLNEVIDAPTSTARQTLSNRDRCVHTMYVYCGSRLLTEVHNVSAGGRSLSGLFHFQYIGAEDCVRGRFHQKVFELGRVFTICVTSTVHAYHEQRRALEQHIETSIYQLIDDDNMVNILFFLDGSKPSRVCYEFCKKKADQFTELTPILMDDLSCNCLAKFRSERINEIQFVSYCLEKGIPVVAQDPRDGFDGIAIYQSPLAYYDAALIRRDFPLCREFWKLARAEASAIRLTIKGMYEQLGETYSDERLPSKFEQYDIRVMQRKRLRSFVSQYAPDKNMLSNMYSATYEEALAAGNGSILWKSEYALFSLVKGIFGDAIYQYRADWLGMQSLDIFVPSLNLGIEYQGKQHYEPIAFFGGEEALKYNKSRDTRKRELCAEQGMLLLEWSYTIAVTKAHLKKQLFELGLDVSAEIN